MTSKDLPKSAPPPTSQVATHPAYLWRNGTLVPWEEATVHVTSIGWTTISAVFEGIRGYWNPAQEEVYLFRLDAHLERLFQSMKLMRMTSPFSAAQLEEAMLTLIKANDLRDDCYLQPLAYFGSGIPGYLAALEQPGEVLITARPIPSNLGTDKVSHCCISTWVRLSDNVMPPRAKTMTNYQNSRLVSTEAQVNGYDAGIILNEQGKVAEGAYACLFLLRKGVAITPPVTAGILESITRESVMELLQEELGMPVQEREVDRTELYVADEVFFCGTYAEIEPIVSVDRYRVGDGSPGSVTRRLQALYQDVVRGLVPRYAHWRTPIYATKARTL